MKRSLLVSTFILSFLGFVVLLLAKPWELFAAGNGSAGTSGSQRAPLVLRTLEVKSEPFGRVLSFSGSIISGKIVSVQPEISGRLMELYFEEGMAVKAGDLLARLSDEELSARLRQIELQIQSAREREARQRMLLGRELVPQQEYDESLNRLRVLEVERELVEASLERTRVRAPFDGIVGLREITPGSMVNSSTRLTTITDPNAHRLELIVPDHAVGQVQTGMVVWSYISRDTQARQARITARDLALDQNVRSLRMRADFLDSPAQLIPGQFARVEVPLEVIDDAIFVPTNAVQSDFSESFVFVYKDGVALQRNVLTGESQGDRTQIISGLELGDRVLITGIPFLRPGLRVQIEEI